MPNPLSTKSQYTFLSIQPIITSNKILSATDLEEGRILQDINPRAMVIWAFCVWMLYEYEFY